MKPYKTFDQQLRQVVLILSVFGIALIFFAIYLEVSPRYSGPDQIQTADEGP